MNTFDETSLTLLEKVQANHADAWNRLVDLYAPLVRYWCRRSQLPEEDIAEVELQKRSKRRKKRFWTGRRLLDTTPRDG